MLQKTIDRAPHSLKQAFRFGLVGVTNTLLDFGIFALLYYQLDQPLLVANSLAFSAAVVQSYLLNKAWTFKGAKQSVSRKREFGLYLLVQLGALILSNVTVFALSQYLEPMISKVIATLVTFVWGFVLSKKIVFKQ